MFSSTRYRYAACVRSQFVSNNLTRIQVFSGLAISVALLIISFFLTWPNSGQTILHRDLTNPGILQVAWLAGRQGEFAQRVAEVEKPTQQALREAGMFPLHWNEAVCSSTDIIGVRFGESSETLELKRHASTATHLSVNTIEDGP